MDLKEIKERKSLLEFEIRNLLMQFEMETDVFVHGVTLDFTYHREHGGKLHRIYNEITAEINL